MKFVSKDPVDNKSVLGEVINDLASSRRKAIIYTNVD